MKINKNYKREATEEEIEAFCQRVSKKLHIEYRKQVVDEEVTDYYFMTDRFGGSFYTIKVQDGVVTGDCEEEYEYYKSLEADIERAYHEFIDKRERVFEELDEYINSQYD